MFADAGDNAGFGNMETKACGIGGPVTVNLPDRQLKGTFYGLDQDGCFLLNKEGEILKITAGDIFFGQTGKNE